MRAQVATDVETYNIIAPKTAHARTEPMTAIEAAADDPGGGGAGARTGVPASIASNYLLKGAPLFSCLFFSLSPISLHCCNTPTERR